MTYQTSTDTEMFSDCKTFPNYTLKLLLHNKSCGKINHVSSKQIVKMVQAYLWILKSILQLEEFNKYQQMFNLNYEQKLEKPNLLSRTNIKYM